MYSIAQAVKQLKCTKDEFLRAYQEVMNIKPSAKLVEIGEDEFLRIQKFLSGGGDNAQEVLKIDEFSSGNSFFAGLGFGGGQNSSSKVAPPVIEEEKAEIKTHVPSPKDILEEPSKKPFNAEVVLSAKKNFPSQTGEYLPQRRPSRFSGKPQISAEKNTGSSQVRVFHHQAKKPQNNVPAQNLPKREKEVKVSDALIKKETIELGKTVTVKEFSEKMGIALPLVMKTLLSNKIICGITTSLDFDTASLIAAELGVQVQKAQEDVGVQDLLSGNLQSILDSDKECANPLVRAPIVTVMGHVDHGKTTLLDYLRKTTVVSGEAGGITQGIGASVVTHDGKSITFIDTPGHELFTALRARGAKLTNIVVIVIAADDGIKQQTIEAINHAKASEVPIIIAITKIDKPDANPEIIKTQLTEHGLTPEERGGDTPIVRVSARTGEGVDDLLELILLQAEMLQLTYNPHRPAVGVVLDAHKDPRQGVMTSLIVLTGTLKIGHLLLIHNTFGKIKKILNWKGEEIKEATGGDPVLVLGIPDVPEPGRVAEVVQSEKQVHAKIGLIQEQTQKEYGVGLNSFFNKLAQGEKVELKIILKADGSSSLEAVKYALESLVMPEQVVLKIVHADIGNFSESDISLAQASGAFLFGYSTTISTALKKKVQHMGLVLKSYDIIYELVDMVTDLAQGLIPHEEKEVIIGKLTVLGVFYRKDKEMVIGGKVTDGKAKNGALFRVMRGEEILSTGKITSLQKNKDNVDEVAEGHECGMRVRVGKKIVEGDELEFYIME